LHEDQRNDFLSPTQAAASTLADIKPKRGAGDQLQITRRKKVKKVKGQGDYSAHKSSIISR